MRLVRSEKDHPAAHSTGLPRRMRTNRTCANLQAAIGKREAEASVILAQTEASTAAASAAAAEEKMRVLLKVEGPADAQASFSSSRPYTHRGILLVHSQSQKDAFLAGGGCSDRRGRAREDECKHRAAAGRSSG